MKRTLLTVLLGAAAAWAAYAGCLRANEVDIPNSLEGQLLWMKRELKLSDAQFARIQELHRASHPRLQAMAAQLMQLRDEFAAFEHERRNSDRVDFLEFARYVESRRNLDRACLDSTRNLVLASADVMTPAQREHYRHLLSNAEPLIGSILN